MSSWFLAGYARSLGQSFEEAEQNIIKANAEIERLGNAYLAMEAAHDKAVAHIAKLEAEISLLKMQKGGIQAQRDAMIKHHPDSPLLRDSGKRFKDGNVKTNLRLHFEAGFDRAGRELGISDPVAHRQD